MANEVSGNNQRGRKYINQIMGPVLFLVALSLPFLGPMEARVGFGILFWMVYWWVTVAVDIKVTCLVPLAVVAFYQYMPIEEVMRAYAHNKAFLIIGASLVTATWARWGFARRMALRFLLLFGNRVQSQMLGWFLFTGILSFIMGNTPVAAVFAPIAAGALLYAGYETFDQRWNSKAASNILIAVAWGASVGGMTTPLGGGQAVVTLAFMEEYIGHEVFFIDWSLRMIPISLLVMAAMAAFIYYAMKPEITHFDGNTEFYKKELREMGQMTYEEKVVSFGFMIIVLLALTRPLYVDFLSGEAWNWLNPSPLFFIYAILLYFWPSRASKGENLLTIPTLVKYFPIAIIFIWPGAVALGRILTETGAGAVFATWLHPFIAISDGASIFALTAGSNILSQMSSDTAAAGVMIPLVMEAFKDWGGLQFGAIPFMWIAGAALSFSYAVASSTGAQGIVAGFGANLKRMFLYGLVGSVISIVITFLYFYITVAVLKLDLYLLPPS